MASISSLGAGSGLDLETLLTNLLAAESTPIQTRLAQQEASIQASISAFGSFKSALSEFQTATNALKEASAFNGRSASSSNNSIFTASADNTASAASYDINVLNLAETHKLATNGQFSDPSATIGTGQLTISVGSDSFNVNITSGSLTDIRDAVNNATDNTGVTASIITVDGVTPGSTISELVFTANDSGADDELTITVDDDDLVDTDDAGLSQLLYEPGGSNNQLDQLNAALDARITIDGFTVSSATNTFSGAIEGVTITAQGPSPDIINDPPETLNVALDSNTIKSNINDFVSAYNKLIDNIADLTAFDVDAGTSSALNGDFTVRTFQTQLRQNINSRVFGLDTNFDTLVELGLTTDENGKLEVNDTTLDNAIDNGLDDLTAVFSSDSGIATQLSTLLDGYLGSGGIIQTREDGFNTSLEEINDERDQLALRLETVERRFRQQFAALDALVTQLNSTGSFLQQQLANTSNIINNGGNSNNN